VRAVLLMFRATFIAKSISTLSILGKTLNHTPARMALLLNFTSCFLSMKLKVVLCSVVGTVPNTSESQFLFSPSILILVTPEF
jgi:hypothetical protein